ncbi:MAG: CatB-related O-acetyltransferase [Candidatus Staskawiczbacteria bacterium]|nr:CatB-related O-acetyltransferase [Candidatus Staskawiczbacteria bacterium]
MIKKYSRILFTFFYSILLKRKKVWINSTVILNLNSKFGGFNKIHENCNIINASIGRASYLGPNCSLPNVDIGNFCSISPNVKVLPYTHPTKGFISTHPSFFSVLKQAGFSFVLKSIFQETLYTDSMKSKFVIIGSDVWIGEDVKIIGGIRVGDGAIIAAGSIVTKDVPPFAIVGGIPARVIRFRFTDDKIKLLLELKWWYKDFDWIRTKAIFFSEINNLSKLLD